VATDAPAGVLAPLLRELWGELDTEHSFSIWYGWAPRSSPASGGADPPEPPRGHGHSAGSAARAA